MTSSADTSGSGNVVRTLELLWDTGRRPSRGPKPGLTVDRIVEAAIRIADMEGLEAVSMRRVAAELGTGAMSLYRYVPGKAELLALMLDRVQRPAEKLADAGDGTWRSTLEALARSTLALYRRHPWLLGVHQCHALLGPSALDTMEKVLSLIRPMGLSDPELVSVIVMIDNYVVGAARTQAYQEAAEHSSGMTTADFYAAQAPLLEKIMATGRYPVLASLAEDTWSPSFDHFEFGLQRILDGLEVLVERRGGS
ncbi:TetR family transcriptional regulator [Streptomyces sp. F-3]|jgi:AcrR family transcriptional regulator|uniref:TetR/AcrR family transcriptional regulator n=1 Tax=Streptomyces thermogriseus TaxID=75292 RepID=A0ABN1SS87_9ACTN|nr:MULTISPECIES: TetR/AcrR family transcriptional regulator [Streptomyces]MDN5383100.1 TetR/AcrR family transcriptional regulator [Streptomyces sp. LB8]GAT80474.1 TetR family transcriptional regulator [Streptomyces sp. F-3]